MIPKSTIYTILILCLVTPAAHAAVDISAACHNQANALLSSLKSDVFREMTANQSAQVLSLATESCHREFSRPGNTALIRDDGTDAGESSGDTLTDFILRGEKPDKAGNKRLERLRRR